MPNITIYLPFTLMLLSLLLSLFFGQPDGQGVPIAPGIDLSNWPTWLVAILVILNLFKAQISKFFSGLFALKEDQQEHSQDIEANLVDSELQTKAAEQLREARREDRVWEERKLNAGYLHGYLNGKVDGLQASLVEGLEGLRVIQEATRQEIAGLRGEIRDGAAAQAAAAAQTNNLLKDLYIALSKRPGGS